MEDTQVSNVEDTQISREGSVHHRICVVHDTLPQAACICLCHSHQQVTCRSQTSFIGIAGMFAGGGGGGEGKEEREGKGQGPPSSNSVSR